LRSTIPVCNFLFSLHDLLLQDIYNHLQGKYKDHGIELTNNLQLMKEKFVEIVQGCNEYVGKKSCKTITFIHNDRGK
jgi:hypothetical protein